MVRIGLEKRLNDLRQEVTLIREQTRTYSSNIQELQTQAECCKVQFLAFQLEEKRNFLACSRGFVSFTKSKKVMPILLRITAASILTGIVTKDKRGVANVGLSGLNGTFRNFGETDWAVCLESQLKVVTRDNVAPGKVWATWDSVKSALNELEERARKGTQLGNLDAVLTQLRRSDRLKTISTQMYYAVPKVDYVLVAGNQGTIKHWLRIPEVISEDANGRPTSSNDSSKERQSVNQTAQNNL